MKQPFHLTLSGYLRSHGTLLFSTLAALCLFLTVSKLSVLLFLAVFAAVAFTLWLEGPRPREGLQKSALLPALAMAYMGAAAFLNTWNHSYMAGVIAGMLPFSLDPVIPVCCGAGVLFGFYAFYRLSCRLIRVLLPGQDLPATAGNFRRNWWFSASALVFFLLEPTSSVTYPGAAGLAVALSLVMALHCPDLTRYLRDLSRRDRIPALLTALGICLFRAENALSALSPAALLAAVLSLSFVLLCVTVFFRTVFSQIRSLGFLQTVSAREWLLYGLILLVLLGFTGYVYANTGLFSVADYPYDIVYTGDFPVLVNEDVTLSLVHHENDLRQPLFAVFSAPFTAVFWLVSRLLGAGAPAHAWILNTVQLALLLLTHLLLAGMLGLTGSKRTWFVLLLSCSYYSLLFSLMMEQYIFAYFYVVLFFCGFCAGKTGSRFALWGSGGTMLTGVILLPLTTDVHPLRRFPEWFRTVLEGGLGFLLVMAAFGRADIVTDVADHIINLNQFSGEVLTFADKCRQFTVFVASCFAAPAAQITPNPWGLVSWQLTRATGIHPGGMAILVLCALSAAVNRKDRAARAAALWAGFSFVVLVLLGWGTAENGLILYALYFGWAYFVLLVRLAQTVIARLGLPQAETVFFGISAALLLLYNFPAIRDLARFLMTHYPL